VLVEYIDFLQQTSATSRLSSAIACSSLTCIIRRHDSKEAGVWRYYQRLLASLYLACDSSSLGDFPTNKIQICRVLASRCLINKKADQICPLSQKSLKILELGPVHYSFLVRYFPVRMGEIQQISSKLMFSTLRLLL